MAEAQNLPQLKMVRDLTVELTPVVDLPEGYRIAVMKPGEEGAWAKVISSVGDLGEWDVARALSSFNGPDRVWREGIHLVWHGDFCCGTTCVQLHDRRADFPELGWVAVHPSERGKGLGTAICRQVLEFMKDHGWNRCYLTTDDHRLPAIKSYLSLGFRPIIEHDSHESRWHEVLVKLNMSSEEVLSDR